MKIQFKHLLAACGAALLTLPSLNAQAGPDGPGGEGRREMRPGQMGERMADELGLTEAQRTSLKALNQEELAAMKALRDDTSVAKEDKRAQLQELRKGYMEKRQALMTPEQRTKAEAMRKHMAERMEKRREGGGPGGPGGEGRPARPRKNQN